MHLLRSSITSALLGVLFVLSPGLTPDACAQNEQVSTDEGKPVSFKVDFTGNNRISSRELRRIVNRPEFDSYSIYLIDDLHDTFVELYKSRGYVDVHIDNQDTEGEDGKHLLTLSIKEGNQYHVTSVTLDGEWPVEENELVDYLVYRPGTKAPYNPGQVQEDSRRLEEFCVSQGYLRARVDGTQDVSAESATAAVTYTSDLGKQYPLMDVSFSGNTIYSASRMLEESGLNPGSPYDPTVSRAARARLLDFYRSESYVNATVDYEVSVRDEPADVTVAYQIQAGQQVRIQSIRVSGNEKTKDRVIERELTIHEGDLFTYENAFESRRRIFSLGLFDDVSVEPASDLTGSATTDIAVRVKEGKWRRLRLGVGYNTLEGPKASLDASYSNLWGLAHEIGVSAEYKGIGDEEELYYRVPHLWGSRYSLLNRIYRSRLEEPAHTVLRSGLGFELERPYGERWLLRYRYSLEDVTLEDVDIDAEDLDINESEGLLSKAGVTVIRDARDNVLTPHRGLLSQMDVDAGGGPLFGDFDFVKAEFRTAWYIPTSERTTLALSGRIGWMEPYGQSSETPLSERFLLGGDDTIRGFPRNEVGPEDRNGDPVGGDAMLLLNAEFRFPIYKKLYGGVFYDTGNVWPDITDLSPSDLRRSAGVGIRYRSPVGVIRLDYGHVLDRRDGEDSGRIHFGVGYSF